jgi:hypothetical protein
LFFIKKKGGITLQTFLPYSSFLMCAKVLDYRRLGKQRVEAMQIISAIESVENGIENRWTTHPTVPMWAPYKECLKHYMNIMIIEWISRGYRNNMNLAYVNDKNYIEPIWLGDERIHSSHRANLLNKLPKHYSQFGWTEEPRVGYFWVYRRINRKWVCFL